MKQVGIFSGSFNPIHVGHLALANYLCEFEQLDEVWFLVTPHNPLKERTSLMDDVLRFQFVKQATAGYAPFKASDFEFHLPQPSYTIDTLNALSKAYPSHQFHLIVGADNWLTFDKWKDYQTLIANYPIFVYPRHGYDLPTVSPYESVRFVGAPIIEISSTFIRESILAGKDVRFFLPPSIYDSCCSALKSE